MKWIENNKLIHAMSIVATCDADIPKSFGKSRHLIKVLRTWYLLVITFFVIFSFISFAIPDDNLNGLKITIGIATFFVFLFDYILHWISFTARDKGRKKVWHSYAIFPITGVGIILLASSLTSVYVIQYLGVFENDIVFKYFETLKFVRIIRLVLLLKVFSPFKILVEAFKEQKLILIYTFVFIFILITVFALIIWNNEVAWLDEQVRAKLTELKISETSSEFKKQYDNLAASMSSGVITNFTDALYYATVTLTTIGYGDFTPHAENSKLIVIIISIMGIAIFAIPSGVVAGVVVSNFQRFYAKAKKEEKKHQKEIKHEKEEAEILEREKSKLDKNH